MNPGIKWPEGPKTGHIHFRVTWPQHFHRRMSRICLETVKHGRIRAGLCQGYSKQYLYHAPAGALASVV